MFKNNEKGTVCCFDNDYKEQIIFELGLRPYEYVYYSNQKLYFNISVKESYPLYFFDVITKKSEQLNQIELRKGLETFVIVNDYLLFITQQGNLLQMNLKTKDLKDMAISNCRGIHSFEDKILIQSKET